MAKKLVEIPKNAGDLAMYHLGSRFPKNALLTCRVGRYYVKVGANYDYLYTGDGMRVNKKLTNIINHGFFAKFVDADIYFLKSYITLKSNTDRDNTLEFRITDADGNVTHSLRVYNENAYSLSLNNAYAFVSRFINQDGRTEVKESEIWPLFYEIAQAATEKFYGCLPAGDYEIEYDPEEMTQAERDRSTEWLKAINAELDKVGYYFKQGWKR